MKKQGSKARNVEPSTPGFIGFGAFGDAAFSSPSKRKSSDAAAAAVQGADSPAASAPSNEILYQGADSEIAAIMRRLQKRDVTTKLKALQELSGAIPTRDRAVVRDLLPSWSYAYLTLALHNDRRVRAGAHNVLGDFIAAGMRKSFAPHLARMLPYWWLCAADPAKEVAAAADGALSKMFPSPAKRVEALSAYASELLGGLTLMLLQSAEELSDMRVSSPEEATERQERVHATILDSLSALIRLLSGPMNTQQADSGAAAAAADEASSPVTPITTTSAPPASVDSSAAASNNGAAAVALASQCGKLWAVLADALRDKSVWRKCGDKTPQIRRAAYRLLAMCAAHAPHIIAEPHYLPSAAGASGAASSPPVLVPKPHIVTYALGTGIGDSTGSNQHAAWEAALSLAKHMPACWGVRVSGLADYHALLASSTAVDMQVMDSHLHAVVEAAKKHAALPSAVLLASDGSSKGAAATVTADIPCPVDLPKILWPKLFSSFKHAGYGAPDALLMSVLPLLASMPVHLLLQQESASLSGASDGGKKKGSKSASAAAASSGTNDNASSTFSIQLLHAVWTGLRASGDEVLTSGGHRLLVHCFTECAVYVLTTITKATHHQSPVLAEAAAIAATNLMAVLAVISFGLEVTSAAVEEDLGAEILTSAAEPIAKEIASSASGVSAGTLSNACLQQLSRALRRLGEVSHRRSKHAPPSAAPAVAAAGTATRPLLDACLDRLWATLAICTTAAVQDETCLLRGTIAAAAPASNVDVSSTAVNDGAAWSDVTACVTALLDAFSDSHHMQRQDWAAVVRTGTGASDVTAPLQSYLQAVTALGLSWLENSVAALSVAPSAVVSQPLLASEVTRPADVLLCILTRTDVSVETLSGAYLEAASRRTGKAVASAAEEIGGLASALTQALVARTPVATSAAAAVDGDETSSSSSSRLISGTTIAEVLLLDLSRLLLVMHAQQGLKQRQSVPTALSSSLEQTFKTAVGPSVAGELLQSSVATQLPSVLQTITSAPSVVERAVLLASGNLRETVDTVLALLPAIYVILQAYQTTLGDADQIARAVLGGEASPSEAPTQPAEEAAAGVIGVIASTLLLKQLLHPSVDLLESAALAMIYRNKLVDQHGIAGSIAQATVPVLRNCLSDATAAAVSPVDSTASDAASESAVLGSSLLSILPIILGDSGSSHSAEMGTAGGDGAAKNALPQLAEIAWLLSSTLDSASPAYSRLHASASKLASSLPPSAVGRSAAVQTDFLATIGIYLRGCIVMLNRSIGASHGFSAEPLRTAALSARLVKALLQQFAGSASVANQVADVLNTASDSVSSSLLWAQLLTALSTVQAEALLPASDRPVFVLSLLSRWVSLLDAAACDTRGATGKAASLRLTSLLGHSDAFALGLLSQPCGLCLPSGLRESTLHSSELVDCIEGAITSATQLFLSSVRGGSGSSSVILLSDALPLALKMGTDPSNAIAYIPAALRLLVNTSTEGRGVSSSPAQVLAASVASMAKPATAATSSSSGNSESAELQLAVEMSLQPPQPAPAAEEAIPLIAADALRSVLAGVRDGSQFDGMILTALAPIVGGPFPASLRGEMFSSALPAVADAVKAEVQHLLKAHPAPTAAPADSAHAPPSQLAGASTGHPTEYVTALAASPHHQQALETALQEVHKRRLELEKVAPGAPTAASPAVRQQLLQSLIAQEQALAKALERIQSAKRGAEASPQPAAAGEVTSASPHVTAPPARLAAKLQSVQLQLSSAEQLQQHLTPHSLSPQTSPASAPSPHAAVLASPLAAQLRLRQATLALALKDVQAQRAAVERAALAALSAGWREEVGSPTTVGPMGVSRPVALEAVEVSPVAAGQMATAAAAVAVELQEREAALVQVLSDTSTSLEQAQAAQQAAARGAINDATKAIAELKAAQAGSPPARQRALGGALARVQRQLGDLEGARSSLLRRAASSPLASPAALTSPSVTPIAALPATPPTVSAPTTLLSTSAAAAGGATSAPAAADGVTGAAPLSLMEEEAPAAVIAGTLAEVHAAKQQLKAGQRAAVAAAIVSAQREATQAPLAEAAAAAAPVAPSPFDLATSARSSSGGIDETVRDPLLSNQRRLMKLEQLQRDLSSPAERHSPGGGRMFTFANPSAATTAAPRLMQAARSSPADALLDPQRGRMAQEVAYGLAHEPYGTPQVQDKPASSAAVDTTADSGAFPFLRLTRLLQSLQVLLLTTSQPAALAPALIEHLQASLAPTIHLCCASLTETPEMTSALAAALHCCRLLAPSLCTSSSSSSSSDAAPPISSSFRTAFWHAVACPLSGLLSIPSDEIACVAEEALPELLAAAAAIPALMAVEVAFLEQQRRHTADVESQAQREAQVAAHAVEEARRQQAEAMAAAEAAAENDDDDGDGLDVDSPAYAARQAMMLQGGGKQQQQNRVAVSSSLSQQAQLLFPPPLPPALLVLVSLKALAKVVNIATRKATVMTAADGSTWEAASLALAHDLSVGATAALSQRHLQQQSDVASSINLQVLLESFLPSLVSTILPAIAPARARGAAASSAASEAISSLDLSPVCPSRHTRAALCRLLEAIGRPQTNASSTAVSDADWDAAFDALSVASTNALLLAPQPAQPAAAPAVAAVGEAPTTAAEPEPAAASAASASASSSFSSSGSVASSFLSAGRSLLTSWLGGGGGDTATSSDGSQTAEATLPSAQAPAEPPVPAQMAAQQPFYVVPLVAARSGTVEAIHHPPHAGATSLVAAAGRMVELMAAATPAPAPSSAGATDGSSSATPNGSGLTEEGSQLSSEAALAASIHRGRSFLPAVLTSALETPALHLQAEFGVDAVCNESGAFGGKARLLTSAEVALRLGLIAMRHVQAAQHTPGAADDLASYLFAPLQTLSEGASSTAAAGASTPGGAGLGRLLTAALHLLLHQDEGLEAARKAGDASAASKPLTSHPDPFVSTLLQLALALVLRVTSALPLRFADLWEGLPRGMRHEAEGFVARRVTPQLFQAQLAVLGGASSSSAQNKAPDAEEAASLLVPAPDAPALALALASEVPSSAEDAQCIDPLSAPPPLSSLSAGTSTSASGPKWDPEQFKVRGTVSSQDVVATYTRDEATLQIRVTMPPSFPLRRVSVACEQRMGVTEDRWRRWELQIKTLLSTKEGTLSEALDFWRASIDKEFEGVEPCPICYSAIHMTNHQLPRLGCPTCKNKFHAACLNKWWQSSHESKCPMCRQAFR